MKGFDHVTIIVADVDAATDSYAKLLGKMPTWRGEHAELGTRAALFGVENGLIELVGPMAGAAEAEGMRTLLEERGQGLYALAFSTDDAAGTSRELREKGLRAAPAAEGEARGADGAVRTYRTVELSPRTTRGLSVLAVERSDLEALCGAPSADAATVEAIDMVTLRTSDPDAALALYGEGLGLRLALDKPFMGTRFLFFRVGGVTIEVVQDASVGERDAFYGLGFRVRDIHAAHARLAKLGFALSEVREGRKPGTEVFTVRDGTCGVKTIFVRDPARD